MNITLESTEITRIYAVTGAPLVQLPYRKSQIIPERLSVEFHDGSWYRMTIAGPRAKKDGTPGVDHSEVTFSASSVRWDPLPEWAAPFTAFDFVPAGE